MVLGTSKTFKALRHQRSHQSHTVSALVEAPKGTLRAGEREFSIQLGHLESSRSCIVESERCVDLGFLITAQNLALANSGKMEPH